MKKVSELKKKTLSVSEVENSPVGINIYFSDYDKLKFRSVNIKNSTLLGIMGKGHLLNKTNIIFSKINTLKATNVNFTSVDIKDSHIIKSQFNKCQFNDAAFINNLIDTVKYNQCSFRMTSITGTHFYNVTFENCDLSNVVINTCHFIKCKFVNCKTSNKVIEMSLLYESYFYNTDIYLESILDNFGITKNSLKKSNVKVNKSFVPNGKHLTSLLKQTIVSEDYITIDKFKLDYFINPSILVDGSELLDQTFNYTNWVELCAIPKSFSLLLEFYSEFLLKNFEENKMPAWGILKLHTMTGSLLDQKISNNEVFRSISGVHLSLSRFVEKFLDTLTQDVLMQKNNKLILLVEGPLDEAYYLENLQPYFENTNLNITRVIKHNSPNELIFSWISIKDIIPIISVLLATRFKIEFENLKKNKNNITTENSTELTPVQLTNNVKDVQAFSLELGFDEKESFLYQLKLKVITPGDLLLNLRLGVNTKILGRIKKILISLLNDTGKK